MKTTSQFITNLELDEIFVFGSNSNGYHLGGAAKLAHEKFNAQWGVGHGKTGNCFAIDTMSGFDILEEDVTAFIEFAKIHTNLKFLVTEIGCGIAGYKVSDVAPIFKECIDFDNVFLPKSFYKYITGHYGE